MMEPVLQRLIFFITRKVFISHNPTFRIIVVLMMEIPLDTPVCLQSHIGKNLQCENRAVVCSDAVVKEWEHMLIKKIKNGKFIIQSCKNGRNLQVQPNGRCVFDNYNELLWEQFDIEAVGDGRFFFISCHTGKVLNCNKKGDVWCVIDYTKRRRWEKWRFIIPDAALYKEMMRLIPLNTPVCLQGHTKKNLQNEFFWRTAKCNNRNMKGWEQMEIKKIHNGKFIIQSRWNGRNLQVQPNGRCVFDNHNELLWEQFDIEAVGDGRYIFISCHTGKLMQCDAHGVVWCANSYADRGDWEMWNIIFPDNQDIKNMMTSEQLNMILIGAAAVVAGVVVIGVVSWALVPIAMSTFGTVVVGVGTIHAPLAMGGVAATLQATSAALLVAEIVVPHVVTAACLSLVVLRETL